MPLQLLKRFDLEFRPWLYTGGARVGAGGRGGLQMGVHKPGPTNTGPYTVTSWIDVNPVGSSNECIVNTLGPHYGKRFWGTVKAIDGAEFYECISAGPDPDSFGPGKTTLNKGMLQNYGTTPGKFKWYDSLLDPSLWVTMRGRASINPYGFGFHGCNVDMLRSEIVWCPDGLNFVGPNGNVPAAVLSQYTRLQQSWVHKGYYANGLWPPDDGQIHCDGFQTNYGRNVDILGNTIGGYRDPIGYNTFPGGYNGGDDFCYSAFMGTQEVPGANDPNSILTNINLMYNWFGGGTTTLNFPVERGCDHSGTKVHYNKFLRRQTDWGATKAQKQDGNPPYVRNTGVGSLITKNPGLMASFVGNVYEDDGTPIPGGG